MIKLLLQEYDRRQQFQPTSAGWGFQINSLPLIKTYPQYANDSDPVDITEHIIDIVLSKRIEYDKDSQITFGECEIELSKNSTTEQIINSNTIKILTLKINDKTYFVGRFDKGYVWDTYKETYIIKVEDILQDFVDFLSEKPLEFVEYNTIVNYSDFLYKELEKYFYQGRPDKTPLNYTQSNIFVTQQFSDVNNIKNTGDYYSTYHWLTKISYASFVDDIDLFTAQDFLILASKLNNFILFYDTSGRLHLRDKYAIVSTNNIPDSIVIEESLSYEYDYKKRYQGALINAYTNLMEELWVMPFFGGADSLGKYFYFNDTTKLQNYYDMRYNLYIDFKDQHKQRGFTNLAVVFEPLHLIKDTQTGIFYEPFKSYYYWDYLYRIVSPSTHLLRMEITSMDYIPGQLVMFANKKYLIIEVNYNINELKSELLLRSFD